MTTFLVTGGAGFIGSHLVEQLCQHNHRVRVLDNLSTGNSANLQSVLDEVEFVEGDIRDEATIARVVQNVEVIFHCAAVVSVPQSMDNPRETEEINTLGTLNLLQAAKNASVKRLVLSSTCAIYGDDPTLPKVEAMAPQPKSPYAISKLSAEMYCQLFNQAGWLETVVLRYFNVYGPRQDPSSAYSGVISIFMDRLRQNLTPTIYGDGEQTRDFVYVKDVVQANLLAAQTSNVAGEIFNIGTGQAMSINKLAQTTAQLFVWEGVPQHEAARNGDVVHSYADVQKARNQLNWSPQTTILDGLAQLGDLKT